MIFARLRGDGPVMIRLRSMDTKIRANLKRAITRSAIELTRYVKENKLSGQVLKNRTGTLRRKINFVTRETATSMTGSVGVKLSYAAAHEYGFDGVVTVREHLRRAKGSSGGGRDSHGRFTKGSEGSIAVRAHQRHMHLPQRSFLRSSLRENAPVIRERLRAAVLEAVQ